MMDSDTEINKTNRGCKFEITSTWTAHSFVEMELKSYVMLSCAYMVYVCAFFIIEAVQQNIP